MSSEDLSYFRHFANLRVEGSTGRSPYRVTDSVFITLCATIAGADTWVQVEAFARARQEWLARFCKLPVDEEGRTRTPSHDTLERLFARLDPAAFGRCFGRWTASLAAALGLKQVAVDGKCLRGSGDESKGLRPLHLVSAWSTENQLSLGQVAVDEKSNEITAIPELLRLLDLEGALVTIDAIGTQKSIAGQIVEQGGDYVLPVKGNQGGLLEDIAASFDLAGSIGYQGIQHDVYSTEESGHGRTERRKYVVLYDLSMIGDLALWAKLTAIGLCVYEREAEGKASTETHCFIGSRRMDAKSYAHALRGHWGIENHLHWQLDVSFDEDRNQVANRNAAQNLAAIRRLALGLLKRNPSKESINTKRYNAALDINLVEQALQAA
jgi:predicted transposase YbfD/YdcC